MRKKNIEAQAVALNTFIAKHHTDPCIKLIAVFFGMTIRMKSNPLQGTQKQLTPSAMAMEKAFEDACRRLVSHHRQSMGNVSVFC